MAKKEKDMLSIMYPITQNWSLGTKLDCLLSLIYSIRTRINIQCTVSPGARLYGCRNQGMEVDLVHCTITPQTYLVCEICAYLPTT